MTQVRESGIRTLTPLPDGVNKVFTTPTEFEAGSFRFIYNGVTMRPDDDKYGWNETGTNEITLTTAFLTGDILQGFYRDLIGTEVTSDVVVVGSPFAPGEC